MAPILGSTRNPKPLGRWVHVFFCLVLILAWSTPADSIQAASTQPSAMGGPISGRSWTGSMGVRETTAQIMARQAQAAAGAPAFLDRPRLSASPNRQSGGGAAEQGPVSGPAIPNAAAVAFTLGIGFDGPGSLINACGTPPDTMGAVGPTQFIVAVNCNIVIYSKATGLPDGVLATTPNNFFSSVRSDSASDPHIRYDRLTQRWFLTMIDVHFPNNRILIAVSDSYSITAANQWTFFYFPTANGTHTNCLADYDTPGIDANALYIGVNQFCGSSLNTASYSGSDGYVVQKSSILGAGPIRVTAFENMADLFTPQGVDNVDPAAAEGYFLGASVNFWDRLVLARVNNPGSLTPTLSPSVAITTATQGLPILQPHRGNTGGSNGLLDASDNRPFAATLRDGKLWTAIAVGVKVTNNTCVGVGNGTADRDAIFWWQIQNIATGQTPQIAQSGQVCDPGALAPAFFSYGTIAPNGQGHAALGYTVAGANNFTEPGVSARLASDPAGTLPTSYISPLGTHPYNPSFDPGKSTGRRWGDYSYTSLDPCDDMTLWTIQEYANPDNQYRERITQLRAPPPATPSAALPAAVAPGQASVSVTVTGTSLNGTGFYDTPASLTGKFCRQRIAASVSNGVTVNSVSYTDPTHLTLDLNTTTATLGPATVTITNPDGQSLGAAILTIGAATVTMLVTAPNPSIFGQAVNLTATVSGSTPTGSVNFYEDATLLGSAPLSGGVGVLSLSNLPVGTHAKLKASYGGDGAFPPSSSSLTSQVVNPAGTSLSIAASPNPALVGQPVTISAALSVAAPGAGTPSGSVNFYDGATLLGSGTLSAGSATFSTSALAVGRHTLTAQYGGDGSFTASTSAVFNLTVNLRIFVPWAVRGP